MNQNWEKQLMTYNNKVPNINSKHSTEINIKID